MKNWIDAFCRYSEQLPWELTHGDMREPPRHTLHPALHRLPSHQRSLQLQDSGGDPRWVIIVCIPIQWMRFSRVVRLSDSQCQSRNCHGFDPSILRHSGIWGAADEALLKKIPKKIKINFPCLTVVFSFVFLPGLWIRIVSDPTPDPIPDPDPDPVSDPATLVSASRRLRGKLALNSWN